MLSLVYLRHLLRMMTYMVSEKIIFWTFSTIIPAFLILAGFIGIMVIYQLAELKRRMIGLKARVKEYKGLKALTEEEQAIKKSLKKYLASTLFLVGYALVILSLAPLLEYHTLGFVFLLMAILWSIKELVRGYVLIIKLIK